MHSELAQQGRAALEEDPQTRPVGIKVVDNNGILSLRSDVGSDSVRRMAEDIASGHPDVMRVLNELEVKPPEERTPSTHLEPPEEHPYIER